MKEEAIKAKAVKKRIKLNMRKLRAERRENHLCWKCGKPLPDGYEKKACPACLRKNNERLRNFILKRRRNNRCIRCGNVLDDGRAGMVYCKKCAMKEADRLKKNKNSATFTV